MKILVTGATGFTGGTLVRRLCDEGHRVSILRRENSDSQRIKHLNIKHHIGDLNNISSLLKSMEGCDSVYHTAALVKQGAKFRKKLNAINVLGSKNLFRAALKSGVKKVVAVSSATAVGATTHPEAIDENFSFNLAHHPYAFSKWQMEQVAWDYCKQGLKIVVVNPTTIFGAGDNHRNTGQILLNAKNGKLFAYPPGGNTVIDVNDVVEGMIAAMNKGRPGHRYILGHERLSYKVITEIIFNVIEGKPPTQRLPKWLLHIVGKGNDVLSRLTEKDMYPSLPAVEMSYKFMYYDGHKAFRELGFKPVVSVEESIRHTHQWYLDSHYF